MVISSEYRLGSIEMQTTLEACFSSIKIKSGASKWLKSHGFEPILNEL